MKKEQINKGLKILFAYYLLWIIFVVIFKMSFSLSDLQFEREINLKPFYYEDPEHISLVIEEMLANIIVFIPLGVFINSILYQKKFAKKFLIIFLIPVLIEIIQYILAIGIADITDIINNSLGGLIGIGIYEGILKLSKNKSRLDKLILIIGSIMAILLSILYVTLLIYNH